MRDKEGFEFPDDLAPALQADGIAPVGQMPQRPAALAELLPVHFVPVSFVAKDWKVTPRRIRALLAAGRLAGQLQLNGYWEVRYPYTFTLGTRGPALKREQRQERRAA